MKNYIKQMKKTCGWLTILCLAAFSMTDLNASKKPEILKSNASNINNNTKDKKTFASNENLLGNTTTQIINEFPSPTNNNINARKKKKEKKEKKEKKVTFAIDKNSKNNNTDNINKKKQKQKEIQGLTEDMPSLIENDNNKSDDTTETDLKKSDGNEMIKRSNNINEKQINVNNGHIQQNEINTTDPDTMSISLDDDNDNNNIESDKDEPPKKEEIVKPYNINNDYEPVGNSNINQDHFSPKVNNDHEDSNKNDNTQSNNNNVNNDEDSNIDNNNNNNNTQSNNNNNNINNNNKQPFYKRYSNAILGFVMFLLSVIVYKLFIIDKNAWGVATKIEAHEKIPQMLKRICLLKWNLT